MQITTNTLILLLALASLAGSACDQIGGLAQKTTDVIGITPRSEPAVTFRARVVGVTDGDTLTVLDEGNQQHTIRLAEIDAPERGQPWGARAKQTLSSLVFGKAVSLQQTDTDRYDRIVARVFADGEDVNRAMVGQGAAWAIATTWQPLPASSPCPVWASPRVALIVKSQLRNALSPGWRSVGPRAFRDRLIVLLRPEGLSSTTEPVRLATAHILVRSSARALSDFPTGMVMWGPTPPGQQPLPTT